MKNKKGQKELHLAGNNGASDAEVIGWDGLESLCVAPRLHSGQT